MVANVTAKTRERRHMLYRRLGWVVLFVGSLVMLTWLGFPSPESEAQAQDQPVPAQRVRLGKQPVAPAAVPPPVGSTAADEGEGHDYTDRVRLNPDRTAKIKIDELNRLIGDGDWGQTVDLAQRILDVKEDTFFKDDRGRWVNARAEANRLLGSLPKDGLQFYEQRYGRLAKDTLKEAMASGDPEAIADVAFRYMHTEAGAEAAGVLGTYHLDHGQYMVAALFFERLLQREGMLEKVAPLTLYKAAMAFERAGDKENAKRVWGEFVKKAQLSDVPLPPALRRKSMEELRQLMALGDAQRLPRLRFDWPVFAGSPSRTAQQQGGSPFLEPAYEPIPLFESATLKGLIEDAIKRQANLGRPALSGFHPIAAGDRLVFRSYSSIQAIDIRSGKIQWRWPLEEISLEYMLQGRGPTGPAGQPVSATHQQYLNSHYANIFYDNTLQGTLSTDNALVYIVEDVALPPIVLPHNRFNPAVVQGGGKWYRHNQLAAYELGDQPGKGGRIRWWIGTSEPDQPFTDHFFLGPPLPLGDKLYVLAEVSSEIRLICLQPYQVKGADGQPQDKVALVWSKNLCGTDQPITDDPIRRTRACHLAYGDGILVCPTNCGALLGVDLLTRSLIWAYSYQELDSGTVQPGGPGIVRPPIRPGMPPGPLDHVIPWATSAPVVREGKVVFTAPDGRAIHCLSLRDGSSEAPHGWKKVKADNDLYLAGVYNGKVVIVNKEYTRALSLHDGSELWRTPTPVPSGRGVANENTYFLPLSTAEVWAIDLDKGLVMGKSQSAKGEVPGNLIFHDGYVLSQTPFHVTAYPQLTVREREITVALEKDPNNPSGLMMRGELRLHRGELPGAISDLRTALRHNPPDDIRRKARAKLYDALSTLLEHDFTKHEELLPELENVLALEPEPDESDAAKAKREAQERERRAKFYRLIARGRQDQGRLKEAFDAYMAFATLGRNELVAIPEEPGTKTLPEVWVQGRINDMIRTARPDQLAELKAALEEQWQKAKAADTVEALERFVAVFGPLSEQGQQATLLLARKLIDAGQLDLAENKLVYLFKQADPPVAAQALDTLARLHIRRHDYENAAWHYGRLARKYPDVIVRDGKTAKQLYEELICDRRFLGYIETARSDWPNRGEIKVEQRTGSFHQVQPILWLTPEGEVPPALRRYRLGVRLNVNNGEGKLLDQVTGKEHSFPLKGIVPPPVYNAHNLQQFKFKPTFRAVGRLFVFSWGHYAYALDPADNKVVWEINLLGPSFNPEYRGASAQLDGVNYQLQFLPDGTFSLVGTDNTRELVGKLCVAEPTAVCITVRGEGLVAVDPLTGKKRWVRSDVAPDTAVFGDGQYVYLVPSSRNTEGTAARGIALRATDGVPVKVRDFAPLFNSKGKLRVIGARILVKEEGPGNVTLRLYDIPAGADVWSKTFAAPALVLTSQTPDLAGVIDADGKVTIVDTASGREIIKAVALDPAAAPPANGTAPEVFLLRDEALIYLVFNRPPDVNAQPVGVPIARASRPSGLFALQTLEVNGPVYALRPGMPEYKWRADDLNEQQLILDRFAELPVLLFATHRIQWVGGANPVPPGGFRRNNHYYEYELIAVDKGSGKVLHEEKHQNRNWQFHTLTYDPRSAVIELISHNYMVTLLLNAKREAAAANPPGAAPGQPPVAPIPGPPGGQVRPVPLPIQQPVPVPRVVPAPQPVPADVPKEEILRKAKETLEKRLQKELDNPQKNEATIRLLKEQIDRLDAMLKKINAQENAVPVPKKD
jgi:tetratricopeptide (TPR) repeat protein